MASKTTAIVPIRVAAPVARRRSSGGVRRRAPKHNKGSSPANIKAKARTRTLALGSLGAFAFGLVKKEGIDLPSVANVPDTLTYGVIGAVAGYLLKSDTLTQLSMGPLFTGLNHLGQQGFGQGSVQLGGEFGDVVSGEFDNL